VCSITPNEDGVARILHAKDWAELEHLTCTSGLGAYNFQNVLAEHTFDKDWDDPKRNRTIEFRQHCGLDPLEMENWVRTCVGIVGFVENSDIKELSRLFSLAWDEKNIDTAKDQLLWERVCNSQFTVISLLRHMKLNKTSNIL
jgi:hypothetical protein